MKPVVEACPQIAGDLHFCVSRRLILQLGRAYEHWLGEQVRERVALLDAVEKVGLPVAPVREIQRWQSNRAASRRLWK